MNSILFLGIFGCAFAAPDLFSIKGKLDGRIVGGKPVRIEDYPYQLSLLFGGIPLCGASIISHTWALTAAHCVYNFVQFNNFVLISNATFPGMTQPGGIHHPALEVLIHELYSESTKDYDIAVIKVGIPFLSSKSIAEAVVLPAPGSSVNAGARAVTSGWGDTKTSEDSNLYKQLRAVQVPIFDWSECAKLYELNYHLSVTKRMICAGYKEGGKDACGGDSGGPLIVDNKQFGIVSWGKGCAVPGQLGVYTNVGNKEIRTWITNRTGI